MAPGTISVAPTTAVFEDAQFGAVSFTNSDGSKRRVVDQGEQTRYVEVGASTTQTVGTATAETQAEQDDRGRADSLALAGFDEWVDIPREVAHFLLGAGATMLDELDQSDASQAFLGYMPLEEGGENAISLHSSLSCDLTDILGSKVGDSRGSRSKMLQATGVDWTATGSVVAASFGRNDIAGWCDLPGALATWNVFRRGFDDEEEHAPDLVLDHSSCLMCVSCHPTKPAVVAAGSFNGEIVVWDTARDEPLLATTKIDDLFHREPVTALSWVYSTKDDDYRLAAISGDGKLLFWSLKNNLQWPVEGYRLPGAVSRRGARDGGKARATPTPGHTAGCTSVSFLKEGPLVTSAVVGTEGGAIMKCGLSPSAMGVADELKSLRWSSEAEELLCRVPFRERRQVLRDVEDHVKSARGTQVDASAVFQSRLEGSRLYPSPDVLRMENHHGPVHAVDCSPFHSLESGWLRARNSVVFCSSHPYVHRALFLSCGADGSVHLYNTLQTRSILTSEPSTANVMDVQWSRARPLVFVAAAEDGTIFVYDLLQSPVMPVATCQTPPSNTSGEGRSVHTTTAVDAGDSHAAVGAVYSVAWNPKQRDLLASGDNAGRILIWRLSWSLSNKRPGEDERLERLFRGSTEGVDPP